VVLSRIDWYQFKSTSLVFNDLQSSGLRTAAQALDELKRRGESADAVAAAETAPASGSLAFESSGSDRARRVRDAVEAALSDIILLGTEEQVRLATRAAADLAAGRAVHVAELVVSLRHFIREVLDLDPMPADLSIPDQGPARPTAGRGGKGEGGGVARDEGRQGGKGGSASGMGAGMGMGAGLGASLSGDEEHERR
jgi:hypothetical protein